LTDTSKLDNLSASYDELLLELQKDEDLHDMKKSPLIFESQNKLLSEQDIPDFLKNCGAQHKKKGFFTWLFGKKKRDEGLNLNLDISEHDILKEQKEKEIAAAKNKERSLMYIEKDFLDEEFSNPEEPIASDFIKKQDFSSIKLANEKTKQNDSDFVKINVQKQAQQNVLMPTINLANNATNNTSKKISESDNFDTLLSEIRKNINDTAEKKLQNELMTSKPKVVSKIEPNKESVPQENFSLKYSDALKSTNTKVSNMYDKLSSMEKEYLTEDLKIKTDEEKIEILQKNLQLLNSQISSMSNDFSLFKSTIQDAISKNTINPDMIAQLNIGLKTEQGDIQELREYENNITQEKNKLRQDLDLQSSKLTEFTTLQSNKINELTAQQTNKLNEITTQQIKKLEEVTIQQTKLNEIAIQQTTKNTELSAQITNLTQVISTCVKQNQFEKLKEMLVQIDAYVDTFDDRERELEKKYQETKEIMSKLELLEVQLNKQSSDYDVIATDLKSKVNFVYKYLQQVQNNMYILSKSIELKKEERELFDQK
jgi:hypothetical protein